MPPSISVVIPLYNRSQRVKYAVDSVLNQTVPVTEIILVDDGSTDDTPKVIRRYLQEHDAWRHSVRYVRQDNHGPNVARNTGLAHAQGEWLAFNDDDDIWLPQKLEWQFRALEYANGRCGACVTDAWFTNNPRMKMTLFQLARKRHSGTVGIIDKPLNYMLQRSPDLGIHPVWLQNLLTRTDLARKIGGFDPALRFGDDDDFVFRLGCEASFCFVNLPLVIIDRTPTHDRHSGASKDWDRTEFRLRMAQLRYEKRLHLGMRLPRDVQKSIKNDLSAVHSGWANWFLKQQDYRRAREAIAAAMRMHVTSKLAAKWVLIRAAPGLTRNIILLCEGYRRRRTLGIG